MTDVDQEACGIEAAFKLLPENAAVHHEWRRLVLKYAVSGRQVHDAHLVATMNIHSIKHLLTLNTRDFIRYPEINAVHPSEVMA
jgi:predicted nucleic acid-binding protein